MDRIKIFRFSLLILLMLSGYALLAASPEERRIYELFSSSYFDQRETARDWLGLQHDYRQKVTLAGYQYLQEGNILNGEDEFNITASSWGEQASWLSNAIDDLRNGKDLINNPDLPLANRKQIEALLEIEAEALNKTTSIFLERAKKICGRCPELEELQRKNQNFSQAISFAKSCGGDSSISGRIENVYWNATCTECTDRPDQLSILEQSINSKEVLAKILLEEAEAVTRKNLGEFAGACIWDDSKLKSIDGRWNGTKSGPGDFDSIRKACINRHQDSYQNQIYDQLARNRVYEYCARVIINSDLRKTKSICANPQELFSLANIQLQEYFPEFYACFGYDSAVIPLERLEGETRAFSNKLKDELVPRIQNIDAFNQFCRQMGTRSDLLTSAAVCRQEMVKNEEGARNSEDLLSRLKTSLQDCLEKDARWGLMSLVPPISQKMDDHYKVPRGINPFEREGRVLDRFYCSPFVITDKDMNDACRNLERAYREQFAELGRLNEKLSAPRKDIDDLLARILMNNPVVFDRLFTNNPTYLPLLCEANKKINFKKFLEDAGKGALIAGGIVGGIGCFAGSAALGTVTVGAGAIATGSLCGLLVGAMETVGWAGFSIQDAQQLAAIQRSGRTGTIALEEFKKLERGAQAEFQESLTSAVLSGVFTLASALEFADNIIKSGGKIDDVIAAFRSLKAIPRNTVNNFKFVLTRLKKSPQLIKQLVNSMKNQHDFNKMVKGIKASCVSAPVFDDCAQNFFRTYVANSRNFNLEELSSPQLLSVNHQSDLLVNFMKQLKSPDDLMRVNMPALRRSLHAQGWSDDAVMGIIKGITDSDMGKLPAFQARLTGGMRPDGTMLEGLNLSQLIRESDELLDVLKGKNRLDPATKLFNEVLGELKIEGRFPFNPALSNEEIRSIIAKNGLGGYLHEFPGMLEAIRDFRKTGDVAIFKSRLRTNLFHNGPNEGFWKFLTDSLGQKGDDVKRLFTGSCFMDEVIVDGKKSVRFNYLTNTTPEGIVSSAVDRAHQASAGINKIYAEIKDLPFLNSPEAVINEVANNLLSGNQRNSLKQIELIEAAAERLGGAYSQQKAFVQDTLTGARQHVEILQRYLATTTRFVDEGGKKSLSFFDENGRRTVQFVIERGKTSMNGIEIKSLSDLKNLIGGQLEAHLASVGWY